MSLAVLEDPWQARMERMRHEAAEQARHRPERWSRHLAQARSLARAGLTEARRSVRALRPEQLENATLAEAVGELTRSWSQQSGVAAELETAGTPTRARHRGRAVPGRAGGPDQRGPARGGGHCPAHAHLRGRHAAAGRGRRRGRVRPGRPHCGTPGC